MAVSFCVSPFSMRFKFLWLLCLRAFSVQAETLTGYVVDIADGDTPTLLDANRQQNEVVWRSMRRKNQAFGERSRQNLAALTFNRQVMGLTNVKRMKNHEHKIY